MASGDFVCDDCSVVDNIHATQQNGPGYHCSQCQNGEWHGRFPREKWDSNSPEPMLNRQAGSDSDTGWPSFS